MSDIHQSKLLDVIKLFDTAEGNLKSSECEVFELDIPSINELRYAGHHITKYIVDKDDEHLNKAEKHCKRAIYDALEIVVVSSLESIRKFEEDYSKSIHVVSVIDGYVNLMVEVNAIKDRLAQVRGNNYESRDEYYSSIGDDRNKLAEISGKLSTARPEINKMDDDSYNKKVRARRVNGIFIVLAIIGIIAEINGNGVMSWIDSLMATIPIPPEKGVIK